MDGLTGVKKPAQVAKEEEDTPARKKKFVKHSPIELYRDRGYLPCKDLALQAALPTYNLLRFSAEIDLSSAGLTARVRDRGARTK